MNRATTNKDYSITERQSAYHEPFSFKSYMRRY